MRARNIFLMLNLARYLSHAVISPTDMNSANKKIKDGSCKTKNIHICFYI